MVFLSKIVEKQKMNSFCKKERKILKWRFPVSLKTGFKETYLPPKKEETPTSSTRGVMACRLIPQGRSFRLLFRLEKKNSFHKISLNAFKKRLYSIYV